MFVQFKVYILKEYAVPSLPLPSLILKMCLILIPFFLMSYICHFGEALYYGFQTMILYIHLGSELLEVVKQLYSCFIEDDSEMHGFQLLASAIGMNLTQLLSY